MRPLLWPYLGLLLSSCAAQGPYPARFEFAHGTEPNTPTYVAVTSDQSVIDLARAELAKPAAERRLHINGRIDRGDAGYNQPWRWHFVPGQWRLVQISMELCDGQPSYVDQNLEEWLTKVRSYCPWASRVKRELR